MAITKAAVNIYTSAAVAPGSVKTAPAVATAVINCSGYYGGELTYKITNTGTAPTAPLVAVFQSSHDGVNWYDYQIVAGDVVASSINSGSILLDRGVMYLRLIAFGNATNAVTLEANLQAVTGV